MRGAAKLTAIALSSAVALGAATFAGYMLSVLWAGKWKYTELIAPICGSVFAAVLAAGCVAYIGRRHRGAGAVGCALGLGLLHCRWGPVFWTTGELPLVLREQNLG